MSYLYETTDEKFYIEKSTAGTRTREPWQTDPVVDPLYHTYAVYLGNSITLSVPYEARQPVNIQWLRNGTLKSQANGPRTGKAIMSINNAQHRHDNNTYTVVVTDSHGRSACTSTTLRVRHPYTHSGFNAYM